MVVAYNDVLTVSSFTANGSTNPDGIQCVTGQPLEFAFRCIPKTAVCLGTGEVSNNGVPNSGVLYASIKDNSATPVQINGRYELLYANASKTNITFLQGSQLDQIRTSKTVRDAANILPAYLKTVKGKTSKWFIGEYEWLIFRFYPNAAANGKTIEIDNCDLQIPVTVLNL